MFINLLQTSSRVVLKLRIGWGSNHAFRSLHVIKLTSHKNLDISTTKSCYPFPSPIQSPFQYRWREGKFVYLFLLPSMQLSETGLGETWMRLVIRREKCTFILSFSARTCHNSRTYPWFIVFPWSRESNTLEVLLIGFFCFFQIKKEREIRRNFWELRWQKGW